MKTITISICMATYNGAGYIVEQLDSIRHQTRQPDEVIICDDCSKDETVHLIQQYISKHGLADKWHLYCNEENKGYPGNFYYAMSLCQGDIVFLADQDDVWEEEKLDIMARVMEKNACFLLLASACSVIDKDGRVVTDVTKDRGHAKASECKDVCTFREISVQQIFYKYEWPGMAMCYRNIWGKEVLKKVQHTRLAHDVALALAAADEGEFVMIENCLQYHRNHDNNAAMEEHRLHKLLNKKRKVLEIKRYIEMLQEILKCESLFFRNINEMFVQYKLSLMQDRLDNLQKGRFTRIIRQYVKNHDYIRLSTMICDCLICWQKCEK